MVDQNYLSLAEDEAKAYNEQVVSRRKYQQKEKLKDKLLKEHQDALQYAKEVN